MRHYKIILKIFQINRIDERKYKVMHAAKKKNFFFFTFQLTTLKILPVTLFIPLHLTSCSF